MFSFIVNPTAGQGKAIKVWQQLETHLQNRKVEYEVNFTKQAGDATLLAKQVCLSGNAKAVIAIGGDGTLHETANGLCDMEIPLGYIPAGTGNDFARSTGIPRDPVRALERILSFSPKKIDIGQVNGKRFLCNAGIGFDGTVSDVVAKSNWKKRWGKLAYAIGVYHVLRTYRPGPLTLLVDGKEYAYDRAWLVAICNVQTYGGGMKICPNANERDGLLDLCVVTDLPVWKFCLLFPRVYKGTHISHPSVHLYQGKKIEIHTSAPLAIHTDGENAGTTPASIQILSQTLLVL